MKQTNSGGANVDESVDSSSAAVSGDGNTDVILEEMDSSFSFYEIWNHEIHVLKSAIDEKIQSITERSQKEIERIAATVTGGISKPAPYKIEEIGPKIPPSQWTAHRAMMKQQYQQEIQQQQRENESSTFSPIGKIEPRSRSLIDRKLTKSTQHRDLRLSPSGRSQTTATSDKTIPQSNLSSRPKQPFTINNVLSIPEEASLQPTTEEENDLERHDEESEASRTSSRSESSVTRNVPTEISSPALEKSSHDVAHGGLDIEEQHILDVLKEQMKSVEEQKLAIDEIVANDIPSMIASMSLSSTSEKSDRSKSRSPVVALSNRVVVPSTVQPPLLVPLLPQPQPKPSHRMFDASKERRLRPLLNGRRQNNRYPWLLEPIQIQPQPQHRQRDAPMSTLVHGQNRPDAPASLPSVVPHPSAAQSNGCGEGNVNDVADTTIVVADNTNREEESFLLTEKESEIECAHQERGIHEIQAFVADEKKFSILPHTIVPDTTEFFGQPNLDALASLPSTEETLLSLTDREVSAICDTKTDDDHDDDDNDTANPSRKKSLQRRKHLKPPSPETFNLSSGTRKAKRKKVSTSPIKANEQDCGDTETQTATLDSIDESTTDTVAKFDGKETDIVAPLTDVESYNKERKIQPHGDSFDPSLIRLEYVTDRKIKDPYNDTGLYTGILILGKPETHGTMKYKDGRYYIGSWKRGRWNGHGKAIFANGDTYTGDYLHDQRHGIGRYEWSDARVYDGRFKNDQRDGHGTYSWPNGSVYCGEFHLGLRHGYGTYTYDDGSVFCGEWSNGKQHGNGECVWADGRSFRGEWVDGHTHSGVEIRADGTIRQDGVRRNSRTAQTKVRQDKKRNTVVGGQSQQIKHRNSFESDQSSKPSLALLRQGKSLVRNVSDISCLVDKSINNKSMLARASTSMSA